MAALSGDYNGCSVFIYDEAGELLVKTTVTYHNKREMSIEVKEAPPLRVGESCRVFIMASPAPCDYQGRINRRGMKKSIALHHGKECESRESIRYKIRIPAQIENLICDYKAYRLHTPLDVETINISKSGVRIRAPFNALSDGDRFQLRMKIVGSEKVMIAEVTNHMDLGASGSEYGCRLLIGSVREG